MHHTVCPSMQSAAGTDFWVTFGQHCFYPSVSDIDLKIRIASGAQATTGTMHFTNSDSDVTFSIAPNSMYDYILTSSQKEQV